MLFSLLVYFPVPPPFSLFLFGSFKAKQKQTTTKNKKKIKTTMNYNPRFNKWKNAGPAFLAWHVYLHLSV